MKRASGQAGLTLGGGRGLRVGGWGQGRGGEREPFDVFHLHLTTKQRKNKLELL